MKLHPKLAFILRLPLSVTHRAAFVYRTRVVKVPIAFARWDSPLVSVVVMACGNWRRDYRCLASLQANLPRGTACQILVCDEPSAGEARTELRKIPGIELIENETKLGIARACNLALAKAKGETVVFLSGAAEIEPGWLEGLLQAFEDPEVGAAGSMLLAPSSQLAEVWTLGDLVRRFPLLLRRRHFSPESRRLRAAGGIVYQDGSVQCFGQGDLATKFEYQFVRPVDFCSLASLAVRLSLVRAIGGLSEGLVPDRDLSFAIRDKGFKVVYQPRSKAVLMDSWEAAMDEPFNARWAEALKAHLEPAEGDLPKAARRLCGSPTVLVVDHEIPEADGDSGSVRMVALMRAMRRAGCHVIFLPYDLIFKPKYAAMLEDMGIECISGADRSYMDRLDFYVGMADAVWIGRPPVYEHSLPVLSRAKRPAVLYDTKDLHFLRLQREAELGLAGPGGEQKWNEMRSLELRLCQSADVTVVHTEREVEILEEMGIRNCAVVPNVHECPTGTSPSFKERKDLVFIGGFRHPPNVDSARWLVEEIMPLVWMRLPRVRLHLLGSYPPPEVLAMRTDLIDVPGFIEDVNPFFLKGRVFVAPLRYGAGMKGKIGQSMSLHLPVVTTKIGAEGMGLVHGHDVLIADDAEAFSEEVVRLYEDEKLWSQMVQNADETVCRWSPETVGEKLMDTIRRAIADKSGR